MPVKTPDFWQKNGAESLILSPLSVFWRLGTWIRRLHRPVKIGVPVICCGGVTVGGAGKTTLALDLAARLSARGMAVHCVTRGYGGKSRGPLRVDPQRHDAALVGDEALLLAAVAPTWVARDRAAGAVEAVQAGAKAIVLDDGFQNPSLFQDAPLLVIDGLAGFGNGRVMPAGPLRESVRNAAARARAAVLIGEDRRNARSFLPDGLAVLQARLLPSDADGSLQGVKVFALAAIAFPAKFHASLRQAGAEIVGNVDFPDHYPFQRSDIERVLAQADALAARAVTTPKDAVRIPPDLRNRFQIVGVQLVWDDPEGIEALLSDIVPVARA